MSEKVTFRGPIDGENRETPLYQTKNARHSNQTNPEAADVPGKDAEETKLSPLTGQISVDYDGVVNLNQFSDRQNPKSALREYLFELESLVLPKQGAGYAVTDEVRDVTYDGDLPVMVEEVRWSLDSTEVTRAEWSVSGVRNRGKQEPKSRRRYIDNQSVSEYDRDKIIISDGPTVPYANVSTRRVTRSIQLNTMQIFNQIDAPSVGLAESGVRQEVNMSGVVDYVSDSVLIRQIDQYEGSQAQIQDMFTGRTYSGVLTNVRSEVQEGNARQAEVDVELTVGTSLFDQQ